MELKSPHLVLLVKLKAQAAKQAPTWQASWEELLKPRQAEFKDKALTLHSTLKLVANKKEVFKEKDQERWSQANRNQPLVAILLLVD